MKAITLEKSFKVTKINGKLGGKMSKLKENDIITVKFDVDGCGGNSPQVDLYANGEYFNTIYARKFNELCCRGSREYVDDYGWIVSRPKITLGDVLA